MRKNKLLIFIFISSCIIAQSCGSKIVDGNGRPTVKFRTEMLKDYALCQCIKEVSNDDSIKNDISFSILTELADYHQKAMHGIDSLTEKVVLNFEPAQIADYNGKKPYLLGCINYYKSKQLDSLIRTFDLKYH